jgi:Lhr-like helicase
MDLLVVDEIHLLWDPQRGARLEGAIARMRQLNPFTRVIALSATLGNPVRADPNLSHRADRILSQGWKPTLRWSAVDKFRSWSVSLTSLVLC